MQERKRSLAVSEEVLGENQSLSSEDMEDMLKVGVDLNEKERGGTYIQKDHAKVRADNHQDGVEVLNMGEALITYPWLREYWWKALTPDKEEKKAITGKEQGYFVRVQPGVKARFPFQAGLYISKEGFVQRVHNIIIVEEDAHLDVINGCASSRHVLSGMHMGISEFYIKKNAKLNFTMVHSWAQKMVVRPRTGTIVEEGGLFLNNYVCMDKVNKLEIYPETYLLGKGSTCRNHTIIVGHPDSYIDVGSRVFLQGEGSRAEILARSINRGGHIINRGHLVGIAPGSRGHLECRGLMLSPEGVIHAIPELEARIDGAELSHEAAVGKIAQEEIEYLMARGLNEEEATATIVRGFINVKIMGLPPQLEEEIEQAIGLSNESGF